MPEITTILRKGDTVRLTKNVAGAPRFTAGTLVRIEDVRFQPMTPPPGMSAQNYLSATYKIAIYEDYRVREDDGDRIRTAKVPHAKLSELRRGTPGSIVYGEDAELFLISPFEYPLRGKTMRLLVDTPVKVMDPGAITNKGSVARRPETAMYEIKPQRIVTRQRLAAKADLLVPKIYFE